MAHIVASITVFVNAPPAICREGTPLQTQDYPDALFLCRENGNDRSCFSGIFMSAAPNKGDLLYLIRNKVDYW